jgi:hypothetical protein
MADPSTVQISIPAEIAYFRAVRLAVGAVAATAGFHVEAIEDLRIAVDELSAWLVEVGDGGDLRFVVCPEPGRGVRIEATVARGPKELDQERFELSQRILSVITDDHGFELSGTFATAWLERQVT